MMSFKGMVAAGAVLAAVVLPASALAASRDFVAGSGKFAFGIGVGKLTVAGHGTPEDARGTIKLDIKGTFFEGLRAKVDCVRVVGNTASLSGVLTKAPALAPSLRHLRVVVQDNGGPRDPVPDAATAFLTDDATHQTEFPCGFAHLGGTLQQGNIVVRDRTP